jgi:HK97 family phage major capsid protein
MMKLQQLRAQRDAKARAAAELNAKYPADQRMPAAEADALDAVLAEVEAIDVEISREVRLAQLAAASNPAAENEQLLNAATRDPAKQGEGVKALRNYLTGGISALTRDQLAELQARVNPDIRNAMSTTTTTEGGFTVAAEYYKQLEEAMKAFGGIRQVATTMRTATGAQMNFPTADATAETGAIVGQNAAVGLGETTFGNLTMDVYKYTSNRIALPWELVQDSFIDIEAYVQGLLAVRLGRITSTHFTTGTGTGQPHGIVTGATVGKTGTSGQTLTVTYDDLVDLEHSVDPAYRSMPGVGFMMNDLSLRNVRKLKDTQNRPIFVPGYEQGNPGGAPDRLLGRPIYISQEMAVMAANARSILFGQFSKYIIRSVMDLTLFRMTDSAFTLNGQVGFVAFTRTGGRLIDVGGAVKAYVNSAT